jgi:mannose-6-phosphate isomerase-like protein (cupin superfamily)
MTDKIIGQISEELRQAYPGAHIKISEDRAEIVAEITPERAVAVIERSLPHFHCTMTETYRGLRGTLYVSCGGRWHVLNPGESLTIEPGNVHHGRGAQGLAWIEVLCQPPWSPDDHHIL